MGGASLPPGFRFHPTDEELVGYYLKRKVEGLEIELEVIPVIDLYKFDPWELPERSFLPNRDMEWFFFCPRDRKYPNGSRTNRATRAGYWKATGKDRKVVCQPDATGCRKTLVFYRGRAPLGKRTDWVMHEYRLCDDSSQGLPSFKGAFALCRVVKRNDSSQKTEHHGGAKGKKAGSSSANGDFNPATSLIEPLIIPSETPSPSGCAYNSNCCASPLTSPDKLTSMEEMYPASAVPDNKSLWISPDLILDSSKDYTQGQEAASKYFIPFEHPECKTPWQPYTYGEISSSSSYSNLVEEVESADDLSRIGCMSPYHGHPNYFGWCGNEGPETSSQNEVYRQTSGDGILEELW